MRLAVQIVVALLVIATLLALGELRVPADDQPSDDPRGLVAPIGELPGPTATAQAVFFRADPVGPLKIDPGVSYEVGLGSLEPGVLVRAIVTVAFNNRLSSISGIPDIDVRVDGPVGAVATYPLARNGHQVAFQTTAAGKYAILLSNERSRVNAKQVGIQFLSP